jgi:hypothetical protein
MALLDDQLIVKCPPAATLEGLATIVASGAGGGKTVTVAIAVAGGEAPAAPGAQVNVNVNTPGAAGATIQSPSA